MRIGLVLSLFLALAGGALAQSQQQATLPSDLIGLMPANLQKAIESSSMTFSTSSYTVANPAAGATVAVITPTSSENGYLIGYKCGGTVQGYFDVYLGSTRTYNSQFFGDYGDSGWVFPPNWQSLTVSGASPISLRNPAQLTGTYGATILVGKTR